MADGKTHGRPILGGFAGFWFFFFIGVLLLTFGVVALDSKLLVVLPILGLVLGVVWARLAPVGRRS